MRDGSENGPPGNDGASSEQAHDDASSLAPGEEVKDSVLLEIARGLVVSGPLEPLAEKTAVVAAHGHEDARGAGPVPLERGAEVGRYVVLETLGSGGMGVVYAAYDPKLDRRIALKLLRSDAQVTAGARARLSREAQAMARLSHPNVVTVYDVGTIDADVFVAMEYVHGTTLAAWLRERKRSSAEILGVFRLAGAGLAAAHSAGIIHRDFKPDNVLIGDDGSVRVTDFGLARTDVSEEAVTATSTTQRPTASAALTQRGHVMGTPAYMAPEQAEAGVVDARSDLFSFCVALYEALYEEHPFAGRTISVLRDAARRAAVREPPRGSSVPVWLRRILLSGLAGDPAARPASMSALLASLARDPGARRRRAIWSGALFAVVCGAVALSVWALHAGAPTCAGAERKLAGVWDEARKREVKSAFLATGRSFAADAWRATERALDEYARRFVGMHTEACEATRIHGDQSEELLDLRVQCLSTRLGGLAALSAVFAQADSRVVEKAAEAGQRLAPVADCADVAALRSGAPPRADEAARAHVAEARSNLDRAKALADTGKPREALGPATAALSAAERSGFGPILAEALYRKGNVEHDAGELRAARESLAAAYRRGLASRSDEIAARAAIDLVRVEGRKPQRYREADRWAEDADALLMRMGDPPRLRALLSSGRGVLERLTGQPQEALGHHRRALAALDGTGIDDGLLRADCLVNFAVAELDLARFDSAIARLRQAQAIRGAILGKEHPDQWLVLVNLSHVMLRIGRGSEALELARRALGIVERALGPTHRNVARALMHVGVALSSLARFGEGVPSLEKAASMLERLLGKGHPDTTTARALLARALSMMGRYEDSRKLLEEALAARERKLGPQHPRLVWTLVRLARTLSGMERYAEALTAVERGESIQRALRARDEHCEADLWRQRGEAEVGLGNHREALRSYDRARAIYERLFGPEHLFIGEALLGTGEALLGLRRFAKARAALEHASRLLAGVNRPWFAVRARFALARSLWGEGADRHRAVALASQVRADWARLVPADRVLLGRIDAWLRAAGR
jgi:tetratricopeptide (TPR) repeat protein/predicted Ser/Thr protein kinase